MTIIIAAGGTGGHLYPGIALAREFLRVDPSATIRFIGTRRGIEGKVLPHEGFRAGLHYGVTADGIEPSPTSGRAAVASERPLAVGASVVSSSCRSGAGHRRVYESTGGLGGVSLTNSARHYRAERVSRHGEQNACASCHTHHCRLRCGDSFFQAVESPSVRRTDQARSSSHPRHGGHHGRGRSRKTLLVFGGSGGAHAINLAMMEALSLIFRDAGVSARLSVIHQTGQHDYEEVKRFYESAGIMVDVRPFLFDMPTALHTADLVVCRSGAMTLAELTVCGKPSVLIPLPNAIYQHQAHNAEVLRKAGAALVIPQSELTGEKFADVIGSLLHDPRRLGQMSERSRALGRTDSAQAIVRDCVQLIQGKARG
jgi:UDP-N-acetylglucosamine:LPS N-acetylglucosamine transferase